jgi:hypothetical protein
MRLAQLCAGLADFCALGANMRVVRRPSGHEVHAGDGDLRAVHQRYQVGGLVMPSLATSVEHVSGRFGAKPVGGEARLNAGLHVHLSSPDACPAQGVEPNAANQWEVECRRSIEALGAFSSVG